MGKLTVSDQLACGVTLVPGKKVAILLATNDCGMSGLMAPGSRSQAVSCKKKNEVIRASPDNPAVHQNAYVQDPVEAINADRVGPATVPRSNHQWKIVKARPL